jgi:transposase
MTSKGSEKMTELSIGVDVSKAHLDAACFTTGREARFPNDAAGRKTLRRWIGPAERVARIVYEPTGRFHVGLEQALAGQPLVKVNPLRARRFAEACGARAKTDAIDARMLARMGAQLALPPDPPASEAMRELRELQTARSGLVRDRIVQIQRRDQATLPLLRRQATTSLRAVEQQLAAVEAEIAARIAADPVLAARQDILASIPGFGPRSSATLIVQMPELGAASAKEVAALAGLAPMTRQSGQWHGKARVAGGRGDPRRALYMPALTAIRHHPDIRRFYERLCAAGKPPKVAITAVMRKLVILANTLIAQQRLWEPRPF